MYKRQPESEVIKAICSEDDTNFLDLQSEIREIANVPPFSRMIAITISGMVIANFIMAMVDRVKPASGG